MWSMDQKGRVEDKSLPHIERPRKVLATSGVGDNPFDFSVIGELSLGIQWGGERDNSLCPRGAWDTP